MRRARRDDVEGGAVEFCEVACCDVGWAQLDQWRDAARTVMSLGVLEQQGTCSPSGQLRLCNGNPCNMESVILKCIRGRKGSVPFIPKHGVLRKQLLSGTFLYSVVASCVSPILSTCLPRRSRLPFSVLRTGVLYKWSSFNCYFSGLLPSFRSKIESQRFGSWLWWRHQVKKTYLLGIGISPFHPTQQSRIFLFSWGRQQSQLPKRCDSILKTNDGWSPEK
jgi:hypothetical protein